MDSITEWLGLDNFKSSLPVYQILSTVFHTVGLLHRTLGINFFKSENYKLKSGKRDKIGNKGYDWRAEE